MSGLRRLPLKVAGVIGTFSAAFHVAVLVGAGPEGRSAVAVGWIVLMFVAGVLAWVAADSKVHGRRTAMVASALFFIIGLPANTVFVVIFLAALVLSILGFAGVPKSGSDA